MSVALHSFDGADQPAEYFAAVGDVCAQRVLQRSRELAVALATVAVTFGEPQFCGGAVCFG